MTVDQEQRDLLIRIDERMHELEKRHKNCEIPNKVANHDKYLTQIRTGIAVLIFLVGSGRVIDIIYEVMHFKGA